MLAPWFAEAERRIGISGAPGSTLPPLRMNKAETHVQSVLAQTRDLAQIIPTPMAISSLPRDNRNMCRHSGLCQEFACRFEAKSDMRVTLLREAEASGLLTIQPNSFVRRLEVKDGRVSGVECVLGDPDIDARIVTYSAPVVVVACEVIETIRLLLASGINSPVLGTRVMFHVTGGARSIAPFRTSTWDNAPHTGHIRSYYNAVSSAPARFIKAGILLFSATPGPLASITSKFDGRYLWGSEARSFFNEIYPFKMDLSYVGEGMPTEANRVTQKRGVVDRYKMPVTLITYKPHPFDINAGRYMKDECKRILRLAGAVTEDEAPPKLKPFLAKATTASRLFHAAGGCRFGDDPKAAVLDHDCRVYGLSNCFVTDASFMPTGLGVNPTLTIQANGLRVGARIAETLGRFGA